MSLKCTKDHCYPDETGCNLGELHFTTCPYYHKQNQGESTKEEVREDNFLHFPWTGNSLGLQDLNYLSARSKIIVIGIVGSASSGKTTFLASLYCLLRHGYSVGDYNFAGSLTLTGWENIAWYLSWKPNNDIEFPPHTSSNSGRVPGLLHLAIKGTDKIVHDIVFTDSPGEWFEHWAVNKNDPNAEGAKWVHKYADAFLLFADSEMLGGKEMGKARLQLRTISDRVIDDLEGRPISLIWSKSDIRVAKEVKASVAKHLINAKLLGFSEFEISVKIGEDESWHKNILASVEWVLNKLREQKNDSPIVPPIAQTDLFLSKRNYFHEFPK